MIKFHSTNYNTPDVDLKTAILKGQALDKGLYMLNKIPTLDQQRIFSFKDLSLQEIAFEILIKIFQEQIPKKSLKQIINHALNFEIGLEKIEKYNYLCHLSRGPTCSFKDFGARVLARLMEYFLSLDDKEIIILTATSGDTGGAVSQALYEMSRIKVIVLYPRNEISQLQRKQMTTLGKNVIAIGINGKFDDCQKIIKTAFTDEALQEYNLSTANSINVGRLIPQMIYYFWSYSRIIQHLNEKVIFSVPSGNFGNLTAGLIASKLGLPVNKFISAVNENDEFPKFLSSGTYSKIDPSRNCLSSAMNVGNPSNLARIFDLYGGQIDENGNIQKNPELEKLRNDIISYSISDNLTRDTIVQFYRRNKKIIEPHGAVGWAALRLYRNKNPSQSQIKSVTFETADPAKFPDEIISLIKIKPELPKALENIQNKKEIPNPVEINKYEDFKLFVINNL
ncbi:MAG: threonine synthase [Candidatus Thorarchaeota archaeon]